MSIINKDKRPHSLFVPSVGSGSGYSWRHYSNYIKQRHPAFSYENEKEKVETTHPPSKKRDLSDRWAFLFANELRAAADPTRESRKGPPPQMPKVVVVLGMQAGDEGVEMLTQLLAKDAQVVCKSQGSGRRNADSKTGLNMIPISIFDPKCKCVFGNGMIIDLLKLVEEGRLLEQKGVKDWKSRLIISDRAHVICPDFICPDAVADERRNYVDEERTYVDKAGRVGIRAGDLIDRQADLEIKVGKILSALQVDKTQSLEVTANEVATLAWWKSLVDSGVKSMIADTMLFMDRCLRNPEVSSIIVEGVEPSLRDVDFGNYPHVASVNSTAGGVFTGLGVSTACLKSVFGVFKAFVTRIGDGPFPTEVPDQLKTLFGGETITDQNRVGWLDLPALLHTHKINGFDALAMTHLEALDDLEVIFVGVQYRLNGKPFKGYPASANELGKVEVVFKPFAGWKTSIGGCESFENLPPEARHLVEDVEAAIGVRIRWVGVDAPNGKLITR